MVLNSNNRKNGSNSNNNNNKNTNNRNSKSRNKNNCLKKVITIILCLGLSQQDASLYCPWQSGPKYSREDN